VRCRGGFGCQQQYVASAGFASADDAGCRLVDNGKNLALDRDLDAAAHVCVMGFVFLWWYIVKQWLHTGSGQELNLHLQQGHYTPLADEKSSIEIKTS
jgi:hypothetical protein